MRNGVTNTLPRHVGDRCVYQEDPPDSITPKINMKAPALQSQTPPGLPTAAACYALTGEGADGFHRSS